MHVDTVVPSFDFTGWAPLADLTAHVAQTGSCPFEVVCQRLLVNWKVDAAWAVLAFGSYPGASGPGVFHCAYEGCQPFFLLEEKEKRTKSALRFGWARERLLDVR